MGRKFLNVVRGRHTYRVFLEDIKDAFKKIRRPVPKVPKFREDMTEDDDDLGFDKPTEMEPETLQFQ